MKKDLFSEYNKMVRDKPVVFESQSVMLPNGIIVECEEDRIFGNVIVTARMVDSKEMYAIQVDMSIGHRISQSIEELLNFYGGQEY